jgi:EmrB/QacA subfamily drug resistance transporter
LTTEASPHTVNRWLVLVVACLAQFMVVLDLTIVNVALPSIQKGLSFSDANLQWVVNAYTLVFGGFLMLGGRAADLLGRRRLFVAGIVVFSLASLFNGLAQSSTMLILGRGVQGLGAALVSPAALSIIIATFTDNRERTRALGVWSAIAASGSAVGLLLGGVLTSLVAWQWIFFVNLPVGVVTVLLALRFVPESRADLGHRSFDAGGAVTVTAGLVAIVFGIVQAQTWGWGSDKTIGVLALGVILLAIFVAIESRHRAPLMRLGIFKVRSLAVADASMMLVASAMFGMFFFISLYVQDVLHYSALHAGVSFLPVTFGIMIGAGLAQQLIRRFGPRTVSIIGIGIATAGMVGLTGIPTSGSFVTNVLPGLFPLSIGMGITFVPITLLGTGGVSEQDAGLASGLFNTAQQVGGALGLAILSTLAADHTANLTKQLGPHASSQAIAAAQVAGYHVAFFAAVGMFALGALLLIVFLRPRHVEGLEFDPSAAAAAA